VAHDPTAPRTSGRHLLVDALEAIRDCSVTGPVQIRTSAWRGCLELDPEPLQVVPRRDCGQISMSQPLHDQLLSGESMASSRCQVLIFSRLAPDALACTLVVRSSTPRTRHQGQDQPTR